MTDQELREQATKELAAILYPNLRSEDALRVVRQHIAIGDKLTVYAVEQRTLVKRLAETMRPGLTSRHRPGGAMNGIDLIAWAVAKCRAQGLPPTDANILMLIRAWKSGE